MGAVDLEEASNHLGLSKIIFCNVKIIIMLQYLQVPTGRSMETMGLGTCFQGSKSIQVLILEFS